MDWKPIESTIVFLLTPPEKPQTLLNPDDFRGFLEPPINIGQAISGDLVLSSVRSQIEVVARRTRIEVKDQSSNPFNPSKIAPVIIKVLELVGGLVTTIGLNYQFEIPLGDVPSGQFIAQRFISPDVIKRVESINVLTLAMSLTDGGAQYQIAIQPRLMQPTNPSMFFNTNVSEAPDSESKITDVEWLKSRFSVGWSDMEKIVRRLLDGS
jgi:hypothetical protein